MKKNFAVFAILSFVYASALVFAQEIAIGSYKYPAFILIPIISIVVCSVILLAVLFNIARRKMQFKKGGHIFVFHKPAKEKKHENIYLKEIKKFRKELNSLEAGQAFNMLSDVTSNFFKELLDLHYEFTYDELEKELRKRNKRKELIDICHELSELKYSGRKITKQELEAFAQRIQELIKKEEVRKEVTKLGVSKALAREKTGFLGKISEMQGEQERKKHLLELMKQEEDALKKDMDIAKNIYHKILSSYYKLPSKDRKDVYEKLTNFYEQVNKMLFSSFYSKQSKKQLEYFSRQLLALQKEAEKVISMEKVKDIREGAAERFKLPKLKPEIKREHEIKREKVLKTEELRKLEKVEKEAMERIKNIGEGIIEQGTMRMPEKKEEKTIIREIRYVMPHEHIAAVPSVYKPIHKQSVKQEIHVPHLAEVKEKHIPKPEPAPRHIEHAAKHALPKHIQEKKHTEEHAEIKNKKIMHIAKEEQEIMKKLERLGKSYIG